MPGNQALRQSTPTHGNQEQMYPSRYSSQQMPQRPPGPEHQFNSNTTPYSGPSSGTGPNYTGPRPSFPTGQEGYSGSNFPNRVSQQQGIFPKPSPHQMQQENFGSQPQGQKPYVDFQRRDMNMPPGMQC